MSSYTHSLVVIVEAAHRDDANALAASVDPDAGGAQTFAKAPGLIPADGPADAAATHYGCHTRTTDYGRQQIIDLAASGLYPWATVYDGDAVGLSGAALFAHALADLGLTPVSRSLE